MRAPSQPAGLYHVDEIDNCLAPTERAGSRSLNPVAVHPSGHYVRMGPGTINASPHLSGWIPVLEFHWQPVAANFIATVQAFVSCQPRKSRRDH